MGIKSAVFTGLLVDVVEILGVSDSRRVIRVRYLVNTGNRDEWDVIQPFYEKDLKMDCYHEQITKYDFVSEVRLTGFGLFGRGDYLILKIVINENKIEYIEAESMLLGTNRGVMKWNRD